MPLSVAAKIFAPLNFIERTALFAGSPVLAAAHDVPLLVDKKTPPLFVPAKMFEPLMAISLTSGFVKPAFIADEFLSFTILILP